MLRSAATPRYAPIVARSISDAQLGIVPGAFWAPDTEIFRQLLSYTARQGAGDVAEMGVYYGQSAILIGAHVNESEVFTVIDLFEGSAREDANAEENADFYAGLTQEAFERFYLHFHDRLPVVVQGYSEDIAAHAAHGTHRFVHIDASHLYDNVVKDIGVAQVLLRDDGIVALDDIRSEHTPGVAAAAWQAVVSSNLKPFAISPQKLYATWGDPDGPRQALERWATDSEIAHETQSVNGASLLRIMSVGGRDPHPAKRFIPEVAWPLLARAGNVARRRRTRRLLN